MYVLVYVQKSLSSICKGTHLRLVGTTYLQVFSSPPRDGGLDYKYIYEYDDKGNKIEENIYKSDGSLDYKDTYEYDNKGNKIEFNEYDSDGSLLWKFRLEYDNIGNIIESIEYDSDGIVESEGSFEFEYDENLNWVKKIEHKNTIPNKIIEREIEYYD